MIEFILPPNNQYEPYFEKTVTLSGVVADDPEFKKDDYRFQLKTDAGLVYVMIEKMPKDTTIERSDLVTATGKLERGFGNYAAFLYRPQIVSVAHSSMPDFATKVRAAFSRSVQMQIDNEEQSNLALSFLTGQKNLLTEDQKNKLRLAGLAHVVVASGYHLSLVVGFAKKLFGKISRFATFGSAALMLVLYISITGFSPSMARAGLITFFSLWAWYFGRKFHPARLILYAMAITLFLDTSYINNLAWQLSFASYSGIMFLTPLITKFLYGDKKPGYFASLIIASISAQIFCLPITLYNFGVLPVLALLANVVITPTIPIVMLGTFVLGILPLPPIVFVVKQILAFQLFAIDAIANQPWAGFDFGAGQPLVFLAYLPIVGLALLLKWRTGHSFRPSYGKIYAC